MTDLPNPAGVPSIRATAPVSPFSSPAVPRPQDGYRAEVDGLRAVAVLSVMFHHVGISGFHGGFVGVDVFFVISGYLITRILLAENVQTPFGLVRFYERRARRILPALFFMLIASMLMASLWLWPADHKSFSRSLAATAVSLSNIAFWRESGYFDSGANLKPLLHTWSLGVEEQFYLVFPLLLMATLRWRRTLTPWLFGLIALLSLALAQWQVHYQPMAAFFLLPARVWELLLGGLLAWRHQSRSEDATPPQWMQQTGSLLGAALIAGAVLTFSQDTPFPGVAALLPTVGTALVIHCAQPGTWVGRLLRTRVLVGIGLISYSAYLWHQPLLVFARHARLGELDTARALALLALTLLLAYISWRYIERPFRQPGKIRRAPVFAMALTGSAAFFGAGMLGYQNDGFVHLYPAQVQMLQQVQKRQNIPEECWLRLMRDGNFDHACPLGTPGVAPSYVLLGDSHAGLLSAALNQASQKQRLAGLDFSFRSCLPVIHSTYQAQDSTAQTCNALRQVFFAPEQLARWPETVILSGRWTLAMEQQRPDNGEGGTEPGATYTLYSARSKLEGYQQALAHDYADTVRTLLAHGKKVILIYPTPEMGWDVPRRLALLYMRDGRLNADSASVSTDYVAQRNRRTEAALDAIGELPGLSRVRPIDMLCNTWVKNRCVAHLNGVPLYFDNNHLSTVGTLPVVDAIMRQLAAGHR